MRLEREEVYAIKRAAAHAFGADAVVRLFGSRADDTRRGGDIDLHIETGPAIDEWTARGRFEDVAQRAVSLGILSDGRDWADAVRVRNQLAHEYPLDPEKQAGQVNAAWDKCATLFATADAIRDFVGRERLLYGDL